MRCDEAFDRYERILRLPNLLLDHLIGDILTEHMPDIPARTCSGHFASLQAIVEDETVNAFARSMALLALKKLVADGSLAIEELRSYCLALLTHKLERRPSFVWDEVVSLAGDLRIREALPLVERAYRCRLANPGSQTFASIESALSEPGDQQELFPLRDGLLFCRQVIDRFPVLHPLIKSNFQVTIVYLLLALGRSEEAFSQLQQVIEQNPASAQGYAVWADLLSCDSQRFNLRADSHRAQQLLKEALEKATDCKGWDVEMRLAELAASVTSCDDQSSS